MTGAAFDHRRQQRSREGDRGAQIDFEHRVDLLLAEVLQHAIGRQARVCHEHVDAGVNGRLRQPVDLGSRAEVTPGRARSQLVRERLENLLAPAGEQKARPASGERARDRFTEPAGGTSHERRTVSQHYP